MFSSQYFQDEKRAVNKETQTDMDNRMIITRGATRKQFVPDMLYMKIFIQILILNVKSLKKRYTQKCIWITG
jgi:hypothetical protein